MKKNDIQAVLGVQSLLIAVIGMNLVDMGEITMAIVLIICLVINLLLVSFVPRTSYD